MKPNKLFFISTKSESGQTIMSVLVAAGLLGIIMMVVMQMTNEQTKSLKYFTQKTESIELKNFVALQMSQGSVCQYNFNGKKIDESGFATQEIGLNILYNGAGPTAPKLIAVGDSLSGLIVESVVYKNILEVPPAGSGSYTGDIVIKFVDSSAVRPLAPIKIRQNIAIDRSAGTINARPIVGCSAQGNGALRTFFCYATLADRWRAPTCENGYYLKAGIKSTDNNWDGYSSICCFGQKTDSRPQPAIPDYVAGTWGRSYNEIVSMCTANRGLFGNSSVNCPAPDNMPDP